MSLFLTECVSLCESLCLYGCAGVVCVCEAMSITVVLRLFRGRIVLRPLLQNERGRKNVTGISNHSILHQIFNSRDLKCTRMKDLGLKTHSIIHHG